jgi:site-specific DNA-methyltransferase (adenine-specific)
LKFNIIYADPPWKYSSKELQKYNGKRFSTLEKHYPMQGTSWIKSLPISKITDDDAALFLWTTDAHIPDALQVIENWGFKYVTVAFIWSKQTKNGYEAWTLGAWTLKNCELCLLGTKGKMLQYKISNKERQLVKAERTKHSKKPELVRQSIENMFGSLPKIELFAREKPDGWFVWGNEVQSDINLTAENFCTQDQRLEN